MANNFLFLSFHIRFVLNFNKCIKHGIIRGDANSMDYCNRGIINFLLALSWILAIILIAYTPIVISAQSLIIGKPVLGVQIIKLIVISVWLYPSWLCLKFWSYERHVGVEFMTNCKSKFSVFWNIIR